MPRLVRREPLFERIKSYLNPFDFLLWLSEEFEAQELDQTTFATPLGLAVNVIFLIVRANIGSGRAAPYDDVFVDGDGADGWINWLASFIVHLLTLFSLCNALYTFARKRRYRLFESSIDVAPSTPSAQRVRVDSSPVSSSPLRFFSSMLTSASTSSASSRAHPDETRDVWELGVWDPAPLSIRLFCLFSPGHALVYLLLLPTAAWDPRPSLTVVTTLALSALLSIQLLLLQSSFAQQAKDSQLIQKEVLHEYDTKFVHPRLNPVVRSAGTQYSCSATSTIHDPPTPPAYNTVDTYPPSVMLNKGFRTHPNPAYARHFDADSQGSASTTTAAAVPITPAHARDSSNSPAHRAVFRQPQFRPSTKGGSLGVFEHANSPLRKTLGDDGRSPARRERETSPLKKSTFPPPGGVRGRAML